jgi:hypothetical protein
MNGMFSPLCNTVVVVTPQCVETSVARCVAESGLLEVVGCLQRLGECEPVTASYELCSPDWVTWFFEGLLIVMLVAVAVGTLCNILSYGRTVRRAAIVGNHWRSWFISCIIPFTSQMPIATCTIRSHFMKCQVPKSGNAANHTHADAARVRNEGSCFMDLFGRIIGYRPYFVQQSAADVRHKRAGCRTYHWGKDLSVPYSAFEAEPNDLLCLVDVDMYMDIPLLMMEHEGPILINTFQPSRVAHCGPEFAFTFDRHNKVSYKVTGGASYTHEVWNYAGDVLTVKNRTWYGKYSYAVYNLDKRQTESHHQLILLTPIKRVTSWFVDVSCAINASPLTRLKVVEDLDGNLFTRLHVHGPGGPQRSTGRPDSYACATIPASQDDTLSGMARIGKTDLTPAAIKLAADGVSQEEAVILTEYHRASRGKVPDYVYPVAESVFKYQFTPSSYDPDAKPSMLPFMDPIVAGCYAPDQCRSNDKAAVEGRIIKVKPENVVLTAMTAVYMEEFANLMIPVAHRGVPEDFEKVSDKQARPAQQAILHAASMIAAPTVEQGVDTFQKAEAYGKVTEPRIITTIPGVNKNNYSRYVYAFTEAVRACAWYAFALKPREVATRVSNICRGAASVILTDFSRFDGRVSVVLRTFEQVLMLRFFRKEYHQELLEIMATQKNQRAKTRFGVRYETGDARLSGSPETADFNSCDNAFVAYCCLRQMGKSADEAWQALGIYGGDDGLTPNVDSEVYTRVAKEIGQVLEAEVVSRGGSGVSFLARYYSPEVWHGGMDSMCDVLRQVSKLHATSSLPSCVTPVQKLAEKLWAYHYTDINTPVIGEFASAFISAFPAFLPKKLGQGNLRGVAYSHALCEESQQYPNAAGDWMTDIVRGQMPTFDFKRFRSWLEDLRKCKDPAVALHPPLCMEVGAHAVKVPVVINGDFHAPPKGVDQLPQKQIGAEGKAERKEYSAEQLAKMASTPCRQAEKCKFGSKCRFKH